MKLFSILPLLAVLQSASGVDVGCSDDDFCPLGVQYPDEQIRFTNAIQTCAEIKESLYGIPVTTCPLLVIAHDVCCPTSAAPTTSESPSASPSTNITNAPTARPTLPQPTAPSPTSEPATTQSDATFYFSKLILATTVAVAVLLA